MTTSWALLFDGRPIDALHAKRWWGYLRDRCCGNLLRIYVFCLSGQKVAEQLVQLQSAVRAFLWFDGGSDSVDRTTALITPSYVTYPKSTLQRIKLGKRRAFSRV